MGSEFGIFWGDSLYVGGDSKKPIIENFLYERDVLCLIADPGVGKSIMALQLLCSLTTGRPFLDTYAVPEIQNVLYVQTEGDRTETLERIRAMKMALPLNDAKWAHLNLPGIYLNTDEGFNKFIAYAKQPPLHYNVIIIDPLYTTVKGSMLNDEVAGTWARSVRKIREIYGSAVIVLHHDNKESRDSDGNPIPRNSNNVFGSVFWAAFFNSTFKLRVNKKVYTLEGGKQRSGKIVDKLTLEMVEPFPLYYRQTTDATHGKSVELVLSTIINNKMISAEHIIRLTGLSKATVYRALRKLQVDKLVGRNEEIYYCLEAYENKEEESAVQSGGGSGQVEHPDA